MMTIKKGERERQRQREKEREQEGGEAGYRCEMKEAFSCPFYYHLSVAPVVKNPSGELVVAVSSQIYGSEGKKGERKKRIGVELSHSSPCNCCLHLGGYRTRHRPPLQLHIQLLLALLSQRAFRKEALSWVIIAYSVEDYRNGGESAADNKGAFVRVI